MNLDLLHGGEDGEYNGIDFVESYINFVVPGAFSLERRYFPDYTMDVKIRHKLLNPIEDSDTESSTVLISTHHVTVLCFNLYTHDVLTSCDMKCSVSYSD